MRGFAPSDHSISDVQSRQIRCRRPSPPRHSTRQRPPKGLPLPEDYALYKNLLHRYAERAGLVLWAYCLMPNHIHLICVPERPQSLASALGRTHADFAKHFNIVGRSCGHVWQGALLFVCSGSCSLLASHGLHGAKPGPVRLGCQCCRVSLVPCIRPHPACRRFSRSTRAGPSRLGATVRCSPADRSAVNFHRRGGVG